MILSRASKSADVIAANPLRFIRSSRAAAPLPYRNRSTGHFMRARSLACSPKPMSWPTPTCTARDCTHIECMYLDSSLSIMALSTSM
jgi:hypothetical protein